MVQETPTKVVGLLGTALVSLFFLFSVSFTNASLYNVEQAFPDPFAPENVVALLDNTAGSYSGFLAENLFHPAAEDFGFIGQELAFAKEAFLEFAGLAEPETVVLSDLGGDVAGASTYNYVSAPGGFNVDTLFALLVE